MSKKNKDGRSFAEKHPRWNLLMGIILLLIMAAGGIFAVYFVIRFIGLGLTNIAEWFSSITSKMDAVVIVALITGGVSISGVIISSIVAKSIDYKKARQAYLAQKREEPYGEFVDVVYKMLQNVKKPNSYTEEQMTTDISKFSKQITLWGSRKVADKWVKFREKGANPNNAIENMIALESIMNEMRKDLGLKKIRKHNLLAFFINDIKKTMKEVRK